MRRHASRFIMFAMMFILVIGVNIPGHASSETALTAGKIINIAHFFKPPNMDAASAVNNFNTIVLTNGDHVYRDQLLANGFSSSIPEYLRSESIQDPGGCTATPANNQVAYHPGDFCFISQNHPDWFLLDQYGNRITVTSSGSYYRMDPANAGWMEFFLTRVLESQQQNGWSALFLDNVEGSLGKFYGPKPAKYPDNASYQAAIQGFLQYLYINYSQQYGRPIYGNIVARDSDGTWFNYLQFLDGAMQERFAVDWDETSYLSADRWLKDMSMMETTQANGKYVILIAPGNQDDLNRQNFAFASYLLISNGKAAFRYSTDDAYRAVWLYDNYKVDLGNPIGPRYQVGTAWRRDFAKGTVTVDPANHTASIQTFSVNPVGAGKYDDGHWNWTYTGAWALYNSSGPYNDTLHYTFIAGDSASFAFQGTQFILTYTQDTNRGSYDVYVDGNKIATINANGTFQWKKAYTSPVFSFGTHLVRFRNAGGGGGVMDVDAIEILAPPTPGAGKYDDGHWNWAYTGAWALYNSSGPYNDTLHYTFIAGDSASFAFQGTQFILTYTQDTNRGSYDVYVDGNKIATINANGTFQWKKAYTSPVFSFGTHLVRFRNAGGGGGVMDVDAIEIK